MRGVDEVKYGRQQVIEHFTSGAVHWGWFYRGTDARAFLFQTTSGKKEVGVLLL